MADFEASRYASMFVLGQIIGEKNNGESGEGIEETGKSVGEETAEQRS